MSKSNLSTDCVTDRKKLYVLDSKLFKSMQLKITQSRKNIYLTLIFSKTELEQQINEIYIFSMFRK